VSRYDYPDAATSVVQPTTEERFAAELSAGGTSLRLAHGRWWREIGRGFFESLHWLAGMNASEARRPGACWGYRTALDEASVGAANASVPLHMVPDIEGYHQSRLPRDAQRAIKRVARQSIRIVHLTDMRVLRDQSYPIAQDWYGRVDRSAPMPSPEAHFADLERRLADPSWLVFAAIDRDDRLLGYQLSWAIDDAGYLWEIKVASQALRLGVTAVLDYEAVRAFQRTGSIRRITAGLHQPEKPTLTTYKVRHGFPVVQVPARAWFLPPMGALMRIRRPGAYYRLTGRGP
jgi:hypothetical protein